MRRGRRIVTWIAIALGMVVLLLAAAFIAVRPMVTRRTRDALANDLPGMVGTFSRVELSLLHLSYTMHGLDVERVDRKGGHVPFFKAERFEAGLYWREILRGHLVGTVRVDHPILVLYATGKKEPTQPSSRTPEAPEDVGKVLQRFVPFRLDRAAVRGGELVWIDAQVPERPELRFHRIEGTLENFATHAALSRGEPSTLALSAKVEQSGQLSLYASADPLAKGLTFAGQARLQGLELKQIAPLLSATTDLKAKKGTLDVSARFKCVDGQLTGGVRPVLRNPEIEQAKPGLGAKLKALLADLTFHIFSDRVPSRNAVATTIPIHGNIADPKTPVWPAVLGAIRNAFVIGITDSLTNLPPHGGSAQAQSSRQARRPPATQSSSVRASHGEPGE